ncbi:alpha-beta hydrolase superfamily lysophospholipase [Actinomycetospora succinea]|uniref:Alpha-beta hydrolase superfamily lysophospholipase n=1 Tax=Actinomycetospora succinea TaxID=663603 RepID=A0A4R6URU9_9PSEU|nr:alpha/beta fold hydrolase [Actinomycetospora succinea]TDQ50048.1 alpha-beta hydrolase superfamily lysophospholipase [Actinomycetospora succinea]
MATFPGSAGTVFHDRWLPQTPVRGTVVLLHGYGEHLGLYDALARRLAAQGQAVHALDAVGHGRSDGERALIASWDLLVDDARTLAGIACAEDPGVPLTLIGHSGGALAALLLALRSPGIADALVLSGAPIRSQEWIHEWLALGEAELPVDDPRDLLSTHPEYVDALLHDPLTHHGGFRRDTLQAVADTWPEVAAGLAAGRPAVPVLLVHGEADPLVPVEHARLTADQLPDAGVVTFPGDLHDVLNEHDRDAVHDVVAEFVARELAVT